MLDYDYAGSLPTREAWSGALAGTVEQTYDAFFRPASQTVTVGARSWRARSRGSTAPCSCARCSIATRWGASAGR